MNLKELPPASPWRTVLIVVSVATADLLMSVVNVGFGLDKGTVPNTDPTALEFLRYAGPLLLAPLGAIALIWRNRAPRTVTVVAALLGGISFSGLAFIVALFLLARRRLDWWVGAFIVLGVAAEVFFGIEPLAWDVAIFAGVALCAVAAWGAYRGQRARSMESRLAILHERAERSETERAADIDRSKMAERHRIAREMHDTLAHRMSLVAIQAAALQVDAPDAETASAAKLMRETAHAALGELRDVLGVLHEDGRAGGRGPAPQAVRVSPPGVGQIAVLLAQWREAGVDIDGTAEPSRSHAIPDAAGRAAYRVVQEGITNASRHAPGARVRVSLTVREQQLIVAVTNGAAMDASSAVGSGLGLVGLAERVALLGGTLEFGPWDGGRSKPGYRLLACIPLSRPGLETNE